MCGECSAAGGREDGPVQLDKTVRDERHRAEQKDGRDDQEEGVNVVFRPASRGWRHRPARGLCHDQRLIAILASSVAISPGWIEPAVRTRLPAASLASTRVI